MRSWRFPIWLFLVLTMFALAAYGWPAITRSPQTDNVVAGATEARWRVNLNLITPASYFSPEATAPSQSATPEPSATVSSGVAPRPTPSNRASSTGPATTAVTTEPADPTATPGPTVYPTFEGDVLTGYQRALGAPDPPVSVQIPDLGIGAPIEKVGLTAGNAMDVPTGYDTIGWYHQGYVPGQAGNAVMTGHLDAPGSVPAVFKRLDELEKGDRVIVITESGRRLTFEVRRMVYYPYNRAPVSEIFGPAETPQLNLITCQGEWLRQLHTYDRRLVVYTEQIRIVDGGRGPEPD
jgi:LPXTG-site transpeptidase (sortase) family protein